MAVIGVKSIYTKSRKEVSDSITEQWSNFDTSIRRYELCIYKQVAPSIKALLKYRQANEISWLLPNWSELINHPVLNSGKLN